MMDGFLKDVQDFLWSVWKWIQQTWQDIMTWYNAQTQLIRVLILSGIGLFILFIIVRFVRRHRRRPTLSKSGTYRSSTASTAGSSAGWNPSPSTPASCYSNQSSSTLPAPSPSGSNEPSYLQTMIDRVNSQNPQEVKEKYLELLKEKARKEARLFYQSLCVAIADNQSQIIYSQPLPVTYSGVYETNDFVLSLSNEEERSIADEYALWHAKKAGVLDGIGYVYRAIWEDAKNLGRQISGSCIIGYEKGPLWEAFEQELLRLCGDEIKIRGYFHFAGSSTNPLKIPAFKISREIFVYVVDRFSYTGAKGRAQVEFSYCRK